MPASEKELEEQLIEAGNRLCSFPSSVDELLALLDRIEICLSRVDQSPPETLQKALAPSIKALVADALLRHADVDVRVAVAACISEITRITAPEAPYDDDQMKDVFKLIVSSFERLYDKSSRSYNKRASILETVSKVRSCVLMLDLECDDLILEMFDHFFTTIRDNHLETVFTSMETIMTLVLEESEEISPELIISILSRLESDKKEVLSVAQKLGQKVLENCASKLKSLLIQIIKELGKSFDDYSKVVANICQGMPGDELNSMKVASNNLADENVLSKTSEVADEVAEETPSEETRHSDEAPVAVASSPKAITSNGTMEKVVDDSAVIKDSSDAAETDGHDDPQTTMEMDQTQNVNKGKTTSVVKSQSQSKPEKSNKKRGRKPNSLSTLSKPFELHVDSDKEGKVSDHIEDKSNNSTSSAHNELGADASVPSENVKKPNPPISAPKVSQNQALDGVSPSPSRTVPVESVSKKVGRGRKKVIVIPTPPVDSDSGKVVEGAVSVSKTNKRTDPEAQIAEETSPTPAEGSNREVGGSNNLDAKSVEKTVKKDDSADNQLEDKKRRRKGRPPKDFSGTPKDSGKKPVSSPKSSAKLHKDEIDMDKSAQVKSKRKRTPGKQKVANIHIGSRIRVWWPEDQEFYEGVVADFDPVDGRHTVTYDDGDVEILYLKDERWELVDDKLLSPKGHVSEGESPVASSEMHKNKKVKPNPEFVIKRGRKPRIGSASSGKKGKATTPRSGLKQKDEGNLNTNSEDKIPEDEKGGDAKDQKDGNGSVNNTSDSSDSAKDDHIDIPKSGTKSKTEAPKTAGKSKAKTTKSGSKMESSGARDLSSKGKEEDVKKTDESGKTPGSGKGKSTNSSKVKKSEKKSGTKRSRGS